MYVKGIHHVSAITKQARENVRFYTEILGMRLVKKTVNQDDPSIYHLFYADKKGSPGTDLTFFEIPMAGSTYQGNNSISLTTLRVPSDRSLEFWQNRFTEMAVTHESVQERAGRKTLAFTDFEGQRLMLVSDEDNVGVAGGVAWERADIPEEHRIVGLGPVQLTVANFAGIEKLLINVLGFRKKTVYAAVDSEFVVFEVAEGGTGAEVHVEHRTDLPMERPGRGSVHHVAFRVSDEAELFAWVDRLQQNRVPNSGVIDRFYFQSIYLRDPNGITIELATDGPGFDVDEPMETLGETLALPPFLEEHREEIEARLTPLDK